MTMGIDWDCWGWNRIRLRINGAYNGCVDLCATMFVLYEADSK